MPFKDWIKELPDGFYILIERTTNGSTLSEFVVLLIYNDERIARYDTAHGFAHRDVLGKKSALMKKVKYPTLNNWEVFGNAIDDFSQNYKAHLAFFESH
jgi:hypothetical protein